MGWQDIFRDSGMEVSLKEETRQLVSGGLFVFGEGKNVDVKVMEKWMERDPGAGDFRDDTSVMGSEVFFRGGLVAQVGEALYPLSLNKFRFCIGLMGN